MSKIIDRTGKGSNISQSENDSNLDSLHGINKGIAGSSYTVDITDQGDTLEFTNGGAVAVTLDSIAAILGAAHTSDFKVTLVAIGAGTVVTITPDALNTINTGVATIILAENEYITIQTDSTNVVWSIKGSSDALTVGGLSASQFLRSDANDTASGDIGFSGAIDLTGTWGIGGVQVTADAAELNNIDGATGATATTSAGTDRVVYNDAGVMKQVALTNLDTYFSATAKTLTNKTLTSPVLNTGVSGTAIDTDGTLAANSDTLLASQKATKTYVDAGFITATDTPTDTALTIHTNLTSAWTTVTLPGAPKYAMIVADAYGIDNTSTEGERRVYARLRCLAGNPVFSWLFFRSGGGATTTLGEFHVGSGSTVVECNGSGQFEIYCYSSGGLAASASYRVVATWG